LENNYFQEDKQSTNYHSNDDGKSESKSLGVEKEKEKLTNSISKTHDSFFPKIKSNLEPDEETKLKNFSKPKSGTNSSTNIINFQIKLEDTVTISLINNNLKKIFYVPSFEIFLVKEIYITNRKSVTTFKENIINWKKKLHNSKRFIKIINDYINQPEGYLSIVLEYANSNSLFDIINYTGCISEELLQNIAIQILEAFEEYNDKFLMDFGEFCPCKIVFNNDGNLKVNYL
jgi:hypothetical protein